jgi:hypothetical protein
MFIYKRCSRFTLISIKNYKIAICLNKYPRYFNSLLSNLPVYTNHLLIRLNLLIQHRYYSSNNPNSTLHFQNEYTNKLKISKSIKGKSGIYIYVD